MVQLNPCAEPYQPRVPTPACDGTHIWEPNNMANIIDQSLLPRHYHNLNATKLYQSSLNPKTFVLLWQPTSQAHYEIVDNAFPIEVAVNFSLFIAENVVGETQATAPFSYATHETKAIVVTGGSKDSLVKLMGWMLACCRGDGIVPFPKNAINPVLSAFADLEMAQILGTPLLLPLIQDQINRDLLIGGCIPPAEIQSRLRENMMTPGEYDFLVEHVATLVFRDMENRFRKGVITQGVYSKGRRRPRWKLPSDIYFDLRYQFPLFDKHLNARIQFKVEAARARRHLLTQAQAETQAQPKWHLPVRVRQEQMVPSAIRLTSLQEGRNIGKNKAGKIDLADLGISKTSFTGAAKQRRDSI